ncbi:MAG: glutathione S-transferase N-terminal domain-containing protein, partial [Nevskiales bacterium]
MSHFAAVSTSFLASALRGGRGSSAKRAVARQPEQTLNYYGFEACPFGRLVREALTELDLDARVYPCPEGGQRYRPQVVALGGKMQLPFLVDPNTGHQQYES